MAFIPLLRFLYKWIQEGRFPREELTVRRWILAVGIVVIGGLAIAVLIALI